MTTCTTVPERHTTTTRSATTRRSGYVASILVNLVLLYLARHLLVWHWPPFLTERYTEVLPLLTWSFVATIVANALFVLYDGGWFRSLANAITAAISFAVAWTVLDVFPFDFSTYEHDWSGVVRILVIVAMVGTAIGCVVETIRFLTWPLRAHPRAT